MLPAAYSRSRNFMRPSGILWSAPRQMCRAWLGGIMAVYGDSPGGKENALWPYARSTPW